MSDETNPYLADLRNPDPIYQLRAYVHDVLRSNEGDSEDNFHADVADLLGLCRTIMAENYVEPEEYFEDYDRGGEPLRSYE